MKGLWVDFYLCNVVKGDQASRMNAFVHRTESQGIRRGDADEFVNRNGCGMVVLDFSW